MGGSILKNIQNSWLHVSISKRSHRVRLRQAFASYFLATHLHSHSPRPLSLFRMLGSLWADKPQDSDADSRPCGTQIIYNDNDSTEFPFGTQISIYLHVDWCTPVLKYSNPGYVSVHWTYISPSSHSSLDQIPPNFLFSRSFRGTCMATHRQWYPSSSFQWANADSHIHILVIGGGIGELAAAIGLSEAGHTVTVFEAARKLREVGAGLQISPNASRLLFRRGLADR